MKWGSCSTCDVITCQQTFASAKLSVNGDEWKKGQAAKSGRGCRCKGDKVFQLDFISLPTLRFLSLSFRAWYRLVKNGIFSKNLKSFELGKLKFQIKIWRKNSHIHILLLIDKNFQWQLFQVFQILMHYMQKKKLWQQKVKVWGKSEQTKYDITNFFPTSRFYAIKSAIQVYQFKVLLNCSETQHYDCPKFLLVFGNHGNKMYTFLIKFSGHQLAEVSPVTWLLQFWDFSLVVLVIETVMVVDHVQDYLCHFVPSDCLSNDLPFDLQLHVHNNNKMCCGSVLSLAQSLTSFVSNVTLSKTR